MALYNISNAAFVDGILVSATWTPDVPLLRVTGRSSTKRRYQVYPVIKDDVDGTGTFIEVVTSITRERVALTYAAANTLQQAIEGVAFNEPANRSTSGSMRLTNRVCQSYSHEYTIETTTEKMVDWVEGPPEEEEAP